MNRLMEEFDVPSLDALAYKTIWALASLNKDKRLSAQYYSSVLLGGPRPVWGLWSAKSGKFVRFYGGRHEIEGAYPTLVWRRKVGTFQLLNLSEKSAEIRRTELAEMYQRRLPRFEEQGA
jgi:hypothetical protein